MTNYQKIEASREARLWLGQILVPALGLVMAFPESRDWVKQKFLEAKWKARSFIGKLRKEL